MINVLKIISIIIIIILGIIVYTEYSNKKRPTFVEKPIKIDSAIHVIDTIYLNSIKETKAQILNINNYYNEVNQQINNTSLDSQLYITKWLLAEHKRLDTSRLNH